MNQAQALYHLQTLDLAIAERRARLAEVESQLGVDEQVRAAEQTLTAAQAALTPWRNRVRDLELEIKSLGEKAATVEKRLYSGAISNPKELQDMQEEIASLRRRRAKLEDDLLEAMIAVENGQAACDEAARHVEWAQSAWSSEQQDLHREHAQLQQALADLRAQREAALCNISSESLTEYNALRPRKQGQAVAELVENTCKRCGVSQTSIKVQQVRQGHTLVHCDNCGRILVLL